MIKQPMVHNFEWKPGVNDSEYINLLEESRNGWKDSARKAESKLKRYAKLLDEAGIEVPE